MVFGQLVEDDRGHGEWVGPEGVERRMQGEQPVLAIDGAQDALTRRHLQRADCPVFDDGVEPQALVARDDHRSRDGREVACLPALLVVLDELFDLSADDLALVRLFVGGDAALEEVPVDLGRGAPAPAAHWLVSLIAVAQDLETHELVDVVGSQGGLIELHAELVHADGGDVEHGGPSARRSGTGAETGPILTAGLTESQWLFASSSRCQRQRDAPGPDNLCPSCRLAPPHSFLTHWRPERAACGDGPR